MPFNFSSRLCFTDRVPLVPIIVINLCLCAIAAYIRSLLHQQDDNKNFKFYFFHPLVLWGISYHAFFLIMFANFYDKNDQKKNRNDAVSASPDEKSNISSSNDKTINKNRLRIWAQIQLFASMASIFMVLPDLMLSCVLHTISFPNDGFFFRFSLSDVSDVSDVSDEAGHIRCGVSAIFAMLWTIPFVISISTGLCLQLKDKMNTTEINSSAGKINKLLSKSNCNSNSDYLFSSIISSFVAFLLIGGDEFAQSLSSNPTYYATDNVKFTISISTITNDSSNVHQHPHRGDGVAVYVLLAELFLGAIAMHSFKQWQRHCNYDDHDSYSVLRCGVMLLIWSANVAVGYSGLLVLFYMFIEG